MADQNIQRYESLIELASSLGRQNEYEEVLRVVAAHALSLFDAEVASIVMINPKTDNTIKTILRNGKDHVKETHHFIQTNVIGWVNKNKQPFITNDLSTDNRFSKNIFRDTTVKSVICTALYSEGLAIGYILVLSENRNNLYNEQDLLFLNHFGVVVAPYLSNLQRISDFFELPATQSVLFSKYEMLGLLGKSKKFKEMLIAVEAAARCDVRVLLEGMSGTGKELIARAIHKLSSRKNYPFIAVDCGAIPEHLIESEFFGHVKGAYTGASQDRKGLFEEAHKGTLFMDEISNLPFDMQSKLLRVLQENEIRVIGSNQTIKVDVRIIAASSPPLRDLVDQKKFREDLYYRLHVYPIQVPTLNERKEDISLLANHFLNRFAKEQNKKIESFNLPVIKYLQSRYWEGNIRELENFIERIVTLTPEKKKTIDTKNIPKEYMNEYKKLTAGEPLRPLTKPLKKSIEEYEKELITKVLADNGWNQSKAARSLKISERAMRYRMEKLGIRKP